MRWRVNRNKSFLLHKQSISIILMVLMVVNFLLIKGAETKMVFSIGQLPRKSFLTTQPVLSNIFPIHIMVNICNRAFVETNSIERNTLQIQLLQRNIVLQQRNYWRPTGRVQVRFRIRASTNATVNTLKVPYQSKVLISLCEVVSGFQKLLKNIPNKLKKM